MIGSVDGLKRSSSGFFASSGSCTVSSLSRTSRLAMSMSVPHANSSTTSDWPVREIECTLRTFLTTPTASSTGWLTRFSISSGAAPS